MKSKGIHGLSKILIEKYKGEVPNTFEALEELPAVGHKTASVVMTQWFGMPAFSSRYAHPPLSIPLGINQWQECRANRKRFKAFDPARAVEQSPSANHLLWQEILPCTKSSLAGLSHLFKIYAKGLTRLVSNEVIGNQ
jgi:hypothetical protein